MSLADFIETYRDELMGRWRDRAKQKLGVASLERAELDDDMPRFVDELVRILRARRAAGDDDPETPSALEHGAERLRIGFDVSEIVREYGILHLSIVDLTGDRGQPIETWEHRELVRCISTGIATAVSEYERRRDLEVEHQASEHLAFVAHELRNALGTALLSLSTFRRNQPTTPVVALERIERSLLRVRDLIDQTLTESRLKHAAQPKCESLSVTDVLSEAKQESATDAEHGGIEIITETSNEALVVEADPRLLRSAITNLVRNAVKFTRRNGKITLRARVLTGGRVAIDVEDECGGLPDGKVDELFNPFVQRGDNRSGFGLGLAIAKQAIEAHRGTIHVRNLPGKGCEFTIDIPAHAAGSPPPRRYSSAMPRK